MARTTGTWGSIERIGNGYRGTYANPIKGAKPSRIKGPVFKTKGETHAWLEQEHAAVREHRQGIRRWTPPKERQVQLQQELLRQNITLASYAKNGWPTTTPKPDPNRRKHTKESYVNTNVGWNEPVRSGTI